MSKKFEPIEPSHLEPIGEQYLQFTASAACSSGSPQNLLHPKSAVLSLQWMRPAPTSDNLISHA
jgi:hypothetical protein